MNASFCIGGGYNNDCGGQAGAVFNENNMNNALDGFVSGTDNLAETGQGMRVSGGFNTGRGDWSDTSGKGAINNGDTTYFYNLDGEERTVDTDYVYVVAGGNVGFGNVLDPKSPLVVGPPVTQTIAATDTIVADACGSVKPIDSAGAVTTGTTDTFTTPASGYQGCVMHVCNVGSNLITLDNNSNFKSAGGLDVVMTADDCVTVGLPSSSGPWYQLTALEAN
jgi:hypothetical protein